MKMKLFLLSMAALAVSADSHAMMRRVPARAAAPRAAQPVRNLPRAQRAPNRSFSIARTQAKPQVEYALHLTEVSPERLQNGLLHSHEKYQELLERKKMIDVQYGEVGKEMAVVGATVFASTILVGSMSHTASASIFAGALAVPITMMTPFIYGYSCLGLGELDKEYASVTEELAALARDQKYQLTNPEDKQ